MQNKLIAGNWKMNTTRSEMRNLIAALKQKTTGIQKTTMMVAPPFLWIVEAVELLKDSKIHPGAQNLYWEEKGAYTGEISAAMLADAGCRYVIIGHSERRQYFKESDADVNRKASAALKHHLLPILCVGETLEQREQGTTLSVVERQIRNGMEGFTAEQASHFTVAYEPVWAIGTGRAATVADAVEVHQAIRHTLTEMFGKETAQQIRIRYGGSVTAENIEGFVREAEIDGALVGGASLKADSFARIIEIAEHYS